MQAPTISASASAGIAFAAPSEILDPQIPVVTDAQNATLAAIEIAAPVLLPSASDCGPMLRLLLDLFQHL